MSDFCWKIEQEAQRCC